MSGQLLVAAAGAAIGSFTPLGPAGGWAIGSAVGSLLFAPDMPDIEGPRIDDLTVQASNYGAPIPKVYGTRVLAGQVIWKTDIKETRHEQDVEGGKGGGQSQTQVSYTYSCSFAVGFCEGEIDGYRRIWADGKLLYDFSEDALSSETQQMVENSGSGFEMYFGTETQTADPTIESFEGTGAVPGMRGLAYIVFDDLQLANFGNRVPNITAEIVDNGSTTYRNEDGPSDQVSDNVLGRGYINDGLIETVTVSKLAPTARIVSWDWDGRVVDDRLAGGGIGGGEVGIAGGNVDALWAPGLTGTTAWRYSSGSNATDVNSVYLSNTGDLTEARNGTRLTIPEPRWPSPQTPGYGLNTQPSWTVSADGGQMFLIWMRTLSGFYQDRRMQIYGTGAGGPYVVQTSPSGGAIEADVQRVGFGHISTTNSDWAIESDNEYVWWVSPTIQSATVYSHNGTGTFTEIHTYTWTWPSAGQRAGIVADKGIALVWALQAQSTYTYVRILSRLPTVNDNPVTIQSIVQDLCLRAGLTAGDIDITSLTDEVYGYSISRPSSTRASIEVMQKIGFFDIVESDWILEFKKRGTASVRTLDTDDMSADFNDPNLQSVVNTVRTQEKDLPKVVKVQYLSPGRDQQASEQSVRRIISTATAEVSERLPVVMSDDKARQIAETMLHATWESRDLHEFDLSVKHLDLEPGDVIEFVAETNQGTKVGRIIETAYQNGVYKIKAVSEEGSTYTPEITGETVDVREQSIPILGPSQLYILDIPILFDNHTKDGTYVAGRGKLPNWPGAQVYRTSDDEVTWDPWFPISEEVISGSVSTVLADARTETWDRGNTVTVKLAQVSWTLSSTTELAALNGTTNFAAIGDHGRWELISFVNATLVTDGEYTLDTFIRGRKNTGRNTGTHTADDKFVLLTSQTSDRAYVEIDKLTQVVPYRAITFGKIAATGETFYQQYVGEGYRPYPVGNLEAQLRSDGQLDVSWKNSYILLGAWNDLVETSDDGSVGSTSVRVYDNDTGDQLRLATLQPGYESTSFTDLNGGAIPAHAASGRKYTFGDNDQYLLIQRPNYSANTEDAAALIINIDTGGILGINTFIWGLANYFALGDFIYYETDCCIYALDYTNNPDNYPAFDTSLAAADYAIVKSDTGYEYGALCVAGDELWGINVGTNEIVKVNSDLTVNTRYSGVPSAITGVEHMDGNATHIFVVLSDLSTYYIYNKSGDSWAGPYTYTLTDNNSPIYQMYVNPNGAVFKSLDIGAQGDTGMRMITNTNSVIFDQVEVLFATTGYTGLGVGAASFAFSAGYPDQSLAEGQQFAVAYVDPTTEESIYQFINTATGAVVENYSRGGYTTEYCQFVPIWNTTVCYPWTFSPQFFWGAQGVSPASGNEWRAWAQSDSHSQITGNFVETVSNTTFEATGGAASIPPLRITVQVNSSTTGIPPSEEVETIVND